MSPGSEDRSAQSLTGLVTEAVPRGGGMEGRGSTYVIRDDAGVEFRCDYTDVVTDGFRTLRAGDRVRFTPVDDPVLAQARFVLKLNEPTTAELYGQGTPPVEPAASPEAGD